MNKMRLPKDEKWKVRWDGSKKCSENWRLNSGLKPIGCIKLTPALRLGLWGQFQTWGFSPDQSSKIRRLVRTSTTESLNAVPLYKINLNN